MASATRGITAPQESVPTFTAFEVIGDWVEIDTNEPEEITNAAKELININRADATQLRVETQILAKGATAIDASTLPVYTATYGDASTKDWVVVSASAPKSGNVRVQDAVLRYSPEIDTEETGT